ncbi:MAG: deoxyribose-phosphate aldolase [Bacteroidetes bacterium QS_3_64_15]|nr:MAG: deoxyribose-phosphate aldolase [Bacteroidetes bacterium QS_3_64_15]
MQRPSTATSSTATYRPPQVPSVDEVAAKERASRLATRSIKTEAKVEGLKRLIAMLDLTTLEGADTPGKVRSLCQKARQPDPNRDSPSVGAVCVYPPLVSVAREEVAGTDIKVASVASYFPSGQAALDERVEEVERVRDAGADEIDVVMNRNAFLSGEYGRVHREISALAEASGDAHLKVILETGELETYDAVRLASRIAMDAGADFIKTSTGKVKPAATMPVTLVMLEAIRDYHLDTGQKVGMKPAGGIRKAKPALRYLVMVKETLGDAWLTPERFRIGASSLLNDLLLQIEKERTGRYYSKRYLSLG